MHLPVSIRRLIAALAFMLALSSCNRSQPAPGDTHLLRVGHRIVTERDFETAFDQARGGYPSDLKAHHAAYQNARWRLLNQLAEEAVILERARALHIEVTPAELEAAVSDIKADFPDDQFEKTLLERAVSFDNWKKGLARRLLIQKVITRELGNGFSITPMKSGDILPDPPEQPSSQEPAARSASGKETTVPGRRQNPAQMAYLDWIGHLQKEFPIEINWELWKKICCR
jgi:SurA-like N-terminal domain